MKECQLSELLGLCGIDSSAGMVKTMMAGASVGYGDLVMTMLDGGLVSSNRAASRRDDLRSQVMEARQKTSNLISKLKAAFIGRK